jgi:pimeloyl-ACP methyl ester carboxylesterase
VASTEIHGGQVVYDLLGRPDGQPIVLTPGGRFSKDVPGLRPLAEALAEGGLRVLLWDRPNCGASDVQFSGMAGVDRGQPAEQGTPAVHGLR